MSSGAKVVRLPKGVSSSGRVFLFHEERNSELEELFQFAYMGISYETVEKSFMYRPHQHTNHELMFITEGTYHASLNGETPKVAVHPGQVFVVEPGNIHAERCEAPLSYYVLWFRLRRVDAKSQQDQISMLGKGLNSSEHVFPYDVGFIQSRLDAIIENETKGGRFSLLLQQTIAKEVFWHLAESFPLGSLNPILTEESTESHFKYRLFSFFEKHYTQNTSIADMAKAFNMSESSFAHKCSDILGVSPAKAFLEFRINMAKKFLQNTGFSVKEIAAQTGFHDASHFSNVFRKNTGVTPREYRGGKGEWNVQ